MPSLAEPLEQPLRLARRRSDRAGGRVARDRLVTMCLLVALAHGLVILGVSFAPPPAIEGSAASGIEVLLVSDELPEELQNEDAVYLAQRTQSGSGNTAERRVAEVPAAGRPQPPQSASQAVESAAVEDQVLAASSERGVSRIQLQPLPATAAQPAPEPGAAEAPGENELRLRGERRDELYVTPDTRASRLAPYLDAWRRRVERIGTVNYPSVARRGPIGSSTRVRTACACGCPTTPVSSGPAARSRVPP
jgi:protein TonB